MVLVDEPSDGKMRGCTGEVTTYKNDDVFCQSADCDFGMDVNNEVFFYSSQTLAWIVLRVR